MRDADGFLSVSCAADPLDLRPALDALTAEIQKRSRSRPLVVLMAELHDRPAHKALRQGLLARLLAGTSPLACGLELEHNLAQKALSGDFLGRLPQSLRDRVGGPDRDGRKLIELFHEMCLPREAPAAYKNILAFCYHNHIPVSANDAAKIYLNTRCRIDPKDPATFDFLRRQGAHKFQAWMMRAGFMSVTSPGGLAFRNGMIAERAVKDMRAKNVPVYVQDCGLSHLFGRTDRNKLFKDSLSACFARAGVDVMPVMVTAPGWGVSDTPTEAYPMLAEKGLVIHGVSGTSFFSIDRRTDEVDFLRRIRRHSGNEIAVYPAYDGLHPLGV